MEFIIKFHDQICMKVWKLNLKLKVLAWPVQASGDLNIKLVLYLVSHNLEFTTERNFNAL